MTQRWELKDARSGVVLAHLNATHFSKSQAHRIGADLANLLNVPITQALRTGAVRNPTLVHHGYARRAAWHVTGMSDQPIAELYFGTANTARAVGRFFSDLFAMPIRMYENTEHGSPPLAQHKSMVVRGVATSKRTNRRRKGGGTGLRMPRKQRRAVGSGRFVKAQHHAARGIARAAARRERHAQAGLAANPKGRNPRSPRIVYNRLLGGWYVVVGPHQTPLNGRFNSKAEAQAWLSRRSPNPKRRALSGRKASRGGRPSTASGRARRLGLGKSNPLDAGYFHGGTLAADGWVEMTRAQWAKIHRDYKGYAESWTDFGKHVGAGTPSVMGRSPSGGSALYPVRIVDAAHLGRRRPKTNRSRRNRRAPAVGKRAARAVRRTVRLNPRESEVRAARRTFRRWHDFDSAHAVRIKAPRRVPPVMAKLGELVSLTYKSDKWAGGRDNPTGKQLLYEHRTQRPRPVLATDPEGRDVFIVGGRMKPTADGLVN